MSRNRTVRRWLALCLIASLAAAASALAARPVPGAFYTGKVPGKGAGFKVSKDGKSMAFRGRGTIGLTCGPNRPPTGSSTAVLVVSAKSFGRVKIRPNGTFRGEGTSAGGRTRFRGKFTSHGKRMVFTLRISRDGGCSSGPIRLHAR